MIIDDGIQESLNGDCLDINELSNAINGELATISGHLHSSEWEARIRNNHTIDKDHPGLQLVYKLLLLGDVGRPCTRAEPKPGVVGDLNGMCDIPRAEDGSY